MPAYRRLRMPRKRPQVLGVDLNRSELSRLLISQGFLPQSVTTWRFRGTLRNKSFSRASVTTAQGRRLASREESAAIFRLRTGRVLEIRRVEMPALHLADDTIDGAGTNLAREGHGPEN